MGILEWLKWGRRLSTVQKEWEMNPKSIVTSKTVLSIIAGLTPVLNAALVKYLNIHIADPAGLWTEIVPVVFAITGIWGRYVARGPLSMTLPGGDKPPVA